MIQIFRKIRQQLVTENNFSTYLIYAVGEIFLVVVGILIALYISNYNQKQNEDKEFTIAIEQIYTHLHSAVELEKWDIEMLEDQLKICQSLKANLDTISDGDLLRDIHFLDWMPGTGFVLQNYDQIIAKLNFEAEENSKNSLVFHLNQFFNLMGVALNHDFINFKIKHFKPILSKYHMPVANGQVITNIRTIDQSDNPLLTDFAIQQIGSIRHTEEFRSALASTEERINRLIWALNFRKTETTAIRQMLLEFDPELKLRYDKLEIVGNAIPENQITSMHLIDERAGIWMIDATLNDGTFEIYSKYAHYFRWGADRVENSNLRFWGEPIEVQAGNYRISLNLEVMKYNIQEK